MTPRHIDAVERKLMGKVHQMVMSIVRQHAAQLLDAGRSEDEIAAEIEAQQPALERWLAEKRTEVRQFIVHARYGIPLDGMKTERAQGDQP